MSSSDSPASILFNTDGYAVGALRDGEFIPFDSAGLLIGGKDSDGYFQHLLVSQAGTLKVTQSSGRDSQRKYFAATGQIIGTNSVQNLLTIENPSGSGIDIYINRVFVNGMADNTATNIFLYQIQRTTTLPSGGTILTSAKRISTDTSAQAVIRESPTASAASGLYWSNSPGLHTSGGAISTNNVEVFNPKNEEAEIVLKPSEAILVSAEGNTVDWIHWVNVYWSEVDND